MQIHILIILFVTFSEFSYNARSMGRCRHLRSVKRHPRNVILVFIFFFLSLIVYIFKNFSQIFADMSACLSDNKVIFTRESVLKFISSLRAWTMDICFFFLVQSYNSITDWLAICLLIKAYFKVTHLFTWWVLVENNNFEIK